MNLETLWFILLAIGLATYVVLDGFDLGAGILHLKVAKNEKERDQVIRSVGPVWDGNEVWLLAGGGTLFFAFPKLYAVSFSGFYLPLMMVLWFLLFRALGIELRHHLHDSMWSQVWDVAFSLSSLLLAVFFGAALGNVVRGVPIDSSGYFFEPLWTNFLVGEKTGILDWYTILVALAATLALSHHGGRWLADRIEGPVAERALKLSNRMAPLVLVFSLLVSLLTFRIAPWVLEHLKERPWGMIFPIIAFVSISLSWIWGRQGKSRKSFIASAIYLYGMMATAAVGIYPFVLPARNPEFSLTVSNAASSTYSMTIALFWWIPGILIATGYFIFLYRKLPNKIS